LIRQQVTVEEDKRKDRQTQKVNEKKTVDEKMITVMERRKAIQGSFNSI